MLKKPDISTKRRVLGSYASVDLARHERFDVARDGLPEGIAMAPVAEIPGGRNGRPGKWVL
jgi:hypothetical protein